MRSGSWTMNVLLNWPFDGYKTRPIVSPLFAVGTMHPTVAIELLFIR